MGHVPEAVRELDRQLPHFPDGRIDYRGARAAAVMTCFVRCGDKLLLLKRSERVGTYPGLWSTITGYLDQVQPIEDRARAELSEELGITLDDTTAITLGEPYSFRDDALGRTWLVHPVLVTLATPPAIALDWEHVAYAWVSPSEISQYACVPNLDRSLRAVLA
jgi:8-oxo-dGTP pyrophosphatase MutT (NUDIX family)